MEKFRASVEARRRGEEPPEDGLPRAYVDELAAERRRSRATHAGGDRTTLDRFASNFDTWALQSSLEGRLDEFLPRLDTYEKDGALWARSSKYGDEDDRVPHSLAGAGKEGRPYRAADVVYLADKLERGFGPRIYVLGATITAPATGTRRSLGCSATSGADRGPPYQLVHLTSGGQQRKMSKRRGDVVFLEEFHGRSRVDAARWYLVNRGPDQTIEIDVDLAAERSQKNPVYYVQYAHARIAGILRNAAGEPSNALRRASRWNPRSAKLIKAAAGVSPLSSLRRRSGGARRRFPSTRFASPTTSTASTTSTACWGARRRRFGSRLSARCRT